MLRNLEGRFLTNCFFKWLSNYLNPVLEISDVLFLLGAHHQINTFDFRSSAYCFVNFAEVKWNHLATWTDLHCTGVFLMTFVSDNTSELEVMKQYIFLTLNWFNVKYNYSKWELLRVELSPCSQTVVSICL